ncbi:protein Smaug homolog 1-like [Nyctibius grandis]|uniref:protein Smaug homolog 1-like n=1 Tax=Nyctibius grandis TaxID=48427 RepID=UPI0035BC0227
MMFRDQVGVLAGWFKGWNECEQTVALLSLLKRVSRTQARFLQLCLEHSLADCTELHILEGEANNPGCCGSSPMTCCHPGLRRSQLIGELLPLHGASFAVRP